MAKPPRAAPHDAGLETTELVTLMQLQQADVGVHALAVSGFSTQLSRQVQQLCCCRSLARSRNVPQGTTGSPKDLGRQVRTQTDVQDTCKVQLSVDVLHLLSRRWCASRPSRSMEVFRQRLRCRQLSCVPSFPALAAHPSHGAAGDDGRHRNRWLQNFHIGQRPSPVLGIVQCLRTTGSS